MMRLPVVIIWSALFLHGRKPSGWSSLFAIFSFSIKYKRTYNKDFDQQLLMTSSTIRASSIQSLSFVSWDGILEHWRKDGGKVTFLTSWLHTYVLEQLLMRSESDWVDASLWVDLNEKVAKLPFLILHYKCSGIAQMVCSYEPKRLLFRWNSTFSAYIQSLRVPEADSLKNGGKVTFLKRRLFTNVLEQCLKSWINCRCTVESEAEFDHITVRGPEPELVNV